MILYTFFLTLAFLISALYCGVFFEPDTISSIRLSREKGTEQQKLKEQHVIRYCQKQKKQRSENEQHDALSKKNMNKKSNVPLTKSYMHFQ